jgi:hypothetical protein
MRHKNNNKVKMEKRKSIKLYLDDNLERETREKRV